VSVFRLVVTCLWAVSLGLFLVFLEAEHVRMQHELLRCEQLREKACELQVRELFRYWRLFVERVPKGSILEFLCNEKEKDRPESWVSQ
jgi:hypothetical protein